MRHEADPAKAAANLAKHGVPFDEAATCLLDPVALVMADVAAQGEDRWVLVGASERGRLLTVAYTMRGDVPRLIFHHRVQTTGFEPVSFSIKI